MFRTIKDDEEKQGLFRLSCGIAVSFDLEPRESSVAAPYVDHKKPFSSIFFYTNLVFLS